MDATHSAEQTGASAESARRVVVVDDHRTFAELLARALALEPDFQCVGHAQSAHDARVQVELLHPDVVVTDIALGLDAEDGIELTQSLTSARPDLLVVVLSALADPDLTRRAAAAGAVGVVPKDGSFTELLDILRRVRLGDLILHPELMSSLLAGPGRSTSLVELTPRERDVLQLLADGLPTRAAARELGISVHTCRGYVKALLLKLDAHSQLEAVVTASRLGLIRVGRTGGA